MQRCGVGVLGIAVEVPDESRRRTMPPVGPQQPCSESTHVMYVQFVGSDDHHEIFHEFIKLFNILFLN